MTALRSEDKRGRREVTEDLLLDALETVLVRDGIRRLSLNAVVEEAGVGKPLIYRYFGDLAGLLSAWAERRGFAGAGQLPGPDIATPGEFREQVATQLVASANHLRAQPVMLELLAEELTADSELSDAFRQARRRQSEPFMRAMLTDERFVEPDARGRIIVLYAAITYLAMRAQRAPAFMGLRLDTDEGWVEAMAMVGGLARGNTDGALHPGAESNEKD